MAYEFKNLNEVERQDKPSENTTVMAFESGQPKQIPASEFGGKGYVLKPTIDEITVDESSGEIIITTNYDDLLKVLEHGGIVWVVTPTEFTKKQTLKPEIVGMWTYIPKDIASEEGFDTAVVKLYAWDYTYTLTNGSYVPNL